MGERRNRGSALKRQLTNQSIIDTQEQEEYKNSNDEEDFIQPPNRRRNHKRHNNNETGFTTTSRTYTNSNQNMNGNKQQAQQKRDHHINTSHTFSQVTQQALNYAAETHLQPIKVECEPKIKEHKEAARFIQQFFKEIEKDFRQQNPTYTRPLGFDIWWIDKEGDIQGVSKQIDVYIYLCKRERYPKEINRIKIIPHPPRHLPPQRSTIIKWVNYEISNKEVKDELEQKYKSIYAIEDIIGTGNIRNRHVRVDFHDANEYHEILSGGTVSLYGQLYSIDEYLPAPKLLICSKCNCPGHVKKSCTISQFDRCRRCGNDRQSGDHETCPIRCHHCTGDHKSTDYSCPVIQQYRRQVILELRSRPDLLPANAHFFIPSGCRDHRDGPKILTNKNVHCEQQSNSNLNYQRNGAYDHRNFNDHNQWPSLPSQLSENSSTTTVIQSFRDELNKLKSKYEDEQRKIEEKFRMYWNSMGNCWTILQQQIETQSEMIKTMHKTVNSCMFFTCASIIESFKLIMNKVKNDSNEDEFNSFLSAIQQHQLTLIDQKTSYVSHLTELEQLERKQREALNLALKSTTQCPNE